MSDPLIMMEGRGTDVYINIPESSIGDNRGGNQPILSSRFPVFSQQSLLSANAYKIAVVGGAIPMTISGGQ